MIINYVLDIAVFRQKPWIGIFQQEDNKHLFWPLTLHARATVLGGIYRSKRGFISRFPSSPLHEHSSRSLLPPPTMSSSAREDVGEETKVDELDEQAEAEGPSRRSPSNSVHRPRVQSALIFNVPANILCSRPLTACSPSCRAREA